MEKTICNNPILSELDENLSLEYKIVANSFPVKDFVKAQQRQWVLDQRQIDCKIDCSKKLITFYENRINDLKLQETSIVFANSDVFSYKDGDAVVTISPTRNGRVMKIWGGYFIHKNASQEAGRSVYTGCEFNGVIKDLTSKVAVDKNIKVKFEISDDKLIFTEEPEICEGFARLPEDFFRKR